MMSFKQYLYENTMDDLAKSEKYNSAPIKLNHNGIVFNLYYDDIVKNYVVYKNSDEAPFTVLNTVSAREAIQMLKQQLQ